jgi:hypothetical protein
MQNIEPLIWRGRRTRRTSAAAGPEQHIQVVTYQTKETKFFKNIFKKAFDEFPAPFRMTEVLVTLGKKMTAFHCCKISIACSVVCKIACYGATEVKKKL